MICGSKAIEGKAILEDDALHLSPMMQGHTNILWPYRITPVSYTHLDVYKRQEIACAILNKPWRIILPL
ncbi:hypothetical protein [Erwinia amylovora]